jgi:hypothetical protein
LHTHVFPPAIWGLIDEKTPNIFTTLDQVFEDGLKTGRERGFLGYRPVLSTHPFKLAGRYEWVTWGEVDDKRRYIGSALHSLFSKGEVGGGEYDTVGIWSANRPGVFHLDAYTYSRLTSTEWQILDIAMQTHRKVSVSLYDTLGKDSVGEVQTFSFSALINIFRLLSFFQNTCNVDSLNYIMNPVHTRFLALITRTLRWYLRPRNTFPLSSNSPLKSLA